MPWYTPTTETRESFLRSSSTGPAWYRGYFNDDLSLHEGDEGLRVVGANTIVVGHTIHRRVNARHGNRVVAIDVRHRKDYLTSFPLRRSEGLMIRDGQYFRLLQDGGVRSMHARRATHHGRATVVLREGSWWRGRCRIFFPQ